LLFTDNSVAEGAFFRGTSSNPKLFSLILRLRALEMHHSLRIHVVHISGKRMIMQGTDGLSRGDLNAGIMRGENMLTFVPLHRGALDRSPDLLQWIQLWSPNRLLRSLSPLEWFTLGHGVTSYSVNTDGVTVPDSQISPQTVLVWSPPPAAAEAALDELSVARHNGLTSTICFYVLAFSLTPGAKGCTSSPISCSLYLVVITRPGWPIPMNLLC
jgi:hypothetical protein